MRENVKVSAVQFASKSLALEENVSRMADFVESEAGEGADLIVFPELASTGYIGRHGDGGFASEFYQLAEPIPGPTTGRIGDVAKRNKVHVVFGMCQQHPRVPYLLYNSAVLINSAGEVAGVHQKVHAAFEEKNYFACGNEVEVFETELGNVAMNVCYDVRFPELARVQALKGAEIIVSIWSSYVQSGMLPSDSIIYRASTRAMENALYFVGCNRSGRDGDNEYYGRSVIASPSGEVIALSGGGEEEVVRATLTNSELLEQRSYLPVFRDRRPDLYGEIVRLL